MSSPMPIHPTMCCICFHSVLDGQHWVDDNGDKWDVHNTTCAIEAGHVPLAYQAEYDQRIAAIHAAEDRTAKDAAIKEHYMWTERAADEIEASLPPEEKFWRWSLHWHHEIELVSDSNQIASNRWLKRIVEELGDEAIPLIIEDLRQGLASKAGPSHWFSALVELTGDDHARGETSVRGAAQKWVQWWDGKQATWVQ